MRVYNTSHSALLLFILQNEGQDAGPQVVTHRFQVIRETLGLLLGGDELHAHHLKAIGGRVDEEFANLFLPDSEQNAVPLILRQLFVLQYFSVFFDRRRVLL